MSGILLDTNIISELTKPQPSAKVLDFLSKTPELWISVLTLHELDYGIARLPRGKRRESLEQVISDFVTGYQDYILPLGRKEAGQAAQFRFMAEKTGKTVHLADALIAGTAKIHGLTLATRNVSDFEPLDIALLNPFS